MNLRLNQTFFFIIEQVEYGFLIGRGGGGGEKQQNYEFVRCDCKAVFPWNGVYTRTAINYGYFIALAL